MKICSEYQVSNDSTKWRNQGYFTTWEGKAWETGRANTSYINDDSLSRWIIHLLRNRMVFLRLDYKNYLKQLKIMHI